MIMKRGSPAARAGGTGRPGRSGRSGRPGRPAAALRLLLVAVLVAAAGSCAGVRRNGGRVRGDPPRRGREIPREKEKLIRTSIRKLCDLRLSESAFHILREAGCDTVWYLIDDVLDPDTALKPGLIPYEFPADANDAFHMRVCAIEIFRDITGEHPADDFGYHADAPPDERKEAVSYIRLWWDENETKLRIEEMARRRPVGGSRR